MNDKTLFRIELVKIFISIAVPVVICLLAWSFQNELFEKKLSNHIEFKKEISALMLRTEVFSQVREPLNTIYAYIEQVGDWDQYSAQEIKDARRYVHKIMYPNRHVWSENTFDLYLKYMDNTAFYSAGKSGAKINARINEQRTSAAGWSDSERELFSGVRHPEHKKTYDRLMNAFACDMALPEVKQMP